MASEIVLSFVSAPNINEIDSQQTWNRFLIFDFAALRCIRFVNNDMLCDASKTLRDFISSVRTKHAFLANHHNCVTHSFHFLHKQLFYLCQNNDETKQKVIVELLELFNELGDGLLKEQIEPKIIYPIDGSFAVLDLLLESDCNFNIKLRGYPLVELLLSLVLTKKASIEDKTILSRIISNVFLQIVGENVVLLKQLCCIATIYLKGVKVGIFEETDLLKSWIEIECIDYISQEIDEAILTEILRCISALCELTKNRIHNLINKLDILLSLCGHKFLAHDLVIIISQAVRETCRNNNIILPFENFLENEITQITQQRINTCTSDLVFIILYLQLKYSRLTLSAIQLKRLICIKLDENSSLSSAVLKGISLLFPIAFNESEAHFKQYSFLLFEALSKEDDLETIITYEKGQFYWIMKNGGRGLKWRVLKLWIKNYNHDESDLILEIIRDCKCGYLLPEFLKTDNREKVGRIIKSLNDPELFRMLCELIPNHVLRIEVIETIINAGAAAPATEEFAAVYLNYFLNIINSRLYKSCLTAILQYVVTIAKQHKSSEIVAYVTCNPKAIQGVLNAVYDDFEGSHAWDYAVTLLYMAIILQVEHRIDVKTPVEVDIIKLTSRSTNKNKFNTMVNLTKHILVTPNSSNMLKLPSETNVELVNLLLNSPDDADLTSVFKVLIRLLADNPHLAFLPTINCYISFTCRMIDVTDSHLTAFMRFLRRFLVIRQNDPWPICTRTRRGLMMFYNKLKNVQNVQFVFQYFKNSQEIDFAKNILYKVSF